MAFGEQNPVSHLVGQSPPVDTSLPYDTASLAGKTILITGGASGFGAAFARLWAKHGAHIALGDIDDAAGEALVAELRTTTPGGEYHHYQHCDVTSWSSQAAFFRAAVQHSATGGIDAVVPNAGIAERTEGRTFERPAAGPKDKTAGNDAAVVDAEGAADAAEPPPDPLPPRLDVIEINLTGVLYTVHLALYWLPRNQRKALPAGGQHAQRKQPDRHILLISSIAGLISLTGQAQYTAAKHAVTGLFRALRGSAFVTKGIRVNMLCPYFVETNIIPTSGLLFLAGAAMGKVDDVVDAGTRLMADESIVGRALVIGPRMLVDESGEGDEGDNDTQLITPPAKVVGLPSAADAAAGKGKAVWECYAEDFANSDVFVLRYVRMLNSATRIRGWIGLIKDTIRILFFRKSSKSRRK